MTTQSIILKRTDSADPDFRLLIMQLDKELNERYGELMQSTYDQHNHIIDIDTVVIAYSNGEAAGCACFKRYDDTSAEIKRMFVKNTERGRGIGYKILSELEFWAKESGFKDTILETGHKQHEAIALYQKLGYALTENYGQYSDLETSICMRKEL